MGVSINVEVLFMVLGSVLGTRSLKGIIDLTKRTKLRTEYVG